MGSRHKPREFDDDVGLVRCGGHSHDLVNSTKNHHIVLLGRHAGFEMLVQVVVWDAMESLCFLFSVVD